MAETSTGSSRWTTVQILICVTASIGFAFDTYELLMLPLIAPDAIRELVGARPGSEESLLWIGRLFYIPAFTGAVFGLLGGWLTDRLGRRRVLTGSILLYAGAAFVSGYSTSIWMLLVCRCLVFIGVCVEFVAAVAWLAELFDDPHRRERVIGYTQAFGSVGGLLVAFVNHEFAKMASAGSLPGISMPGWAESLFGSLQNPDPVWRYTLMSGLFPALPLILIRPFLPESPKWQQKRQQGVLRRPSLAELFTPELRRTTIVTTLLVACSYGMAFGGLQQIPQIVRGRPEVVATAATLQGPQKASYPKEEAAIYSKFQEVGGLIGRLLLALLAIKIVGRRKLLAMFLVPCLLLLPLIFYSFQGAENPVWGTIAGIRFSPLKLAALLGGLIVIGQFSFWGNYLPRVFPLHLRGTGESMAANVGGRMLGTSCAKLATMLAAFSWFPGGTGTGKLAAASACVTGGLALIACVLLFFLPEPPTSLDAEAG